MQLPALVYVENLIRIMLIQPLAPHVQLYQQCNTQPLTNHHRQRFRQLLTQSTKQPTTLTNQLDTLLHPYMNLLGMPENIQPDDFPHILQLLQVYDKFLTCEYMFPMDAMVIGNDGKELLTAGVFTCKSLHVEATTKIAAAAAVKHQISQHMKSQLSALNLDFAIAQNRSQEKYVVLGPLSLFNAGCSTCAQLWDRDCWAVAGCKGDETQNIPAYTQLLIRYCDGRCKLNCPFQPEDECASLHCSTKLACTSQHYT